jgi:hypothetical protein
VQPALLALRKNDSSLSYDTENDSLDKKAGHFLLFVKNTCQRYFTYIAAKSLSIADELCQQAVVLPGLSGRPHRTGSA